MKKTLITVFASVVLCGVSGAAPRIYNANFEEPGKSWKYSKEYSIADKAGINNSKALYVKREKAGKDNGLAWQFIRIEGGKKYQVSVQVKAEITQKGKYKVGAGFSMTLREDRKIVKTLYANGCCESTNGEWKQVKYTFTAPQNVNSLQLFIGLYNGFLGEAWFDDVKIEELP